MNEGVTGGILECWNTGIREEDSVSPVPNPNIPIFQRSNEVDGKKKNMLIRAIRESLAHRAGRAKGEIGKF
jgi:hypothetical protein